MIKRIIKNISCFGLQTSSIESQSGFTLVELLVAMTIGAALSIGLVMAVRTVFSTNSSVVNHVTAINQVQNAVDYISRDVNRHKLLTLFPLISMTGTSSLTRYCLLLLLPYQQRRMAQTIRSSKQYIRMM